MKATECPAEFTGYDEAQTTAIRNKIEAELKDSARTSGWIECEWSDAIKQVRGYQFAVFGGDAYKLMPFSSAVDGDMEFEYLPVVVNGQVFRMTPDEGPGGVMYLTRCIRGRLKGRGWVTVYLDGNWHKASELNGGSE